MDGHRDRRPPHDGFGDATEQKSRQPPPIVRSDDDPIDLVVFRVRHDRSNRATVFERRRYGPVRLLGSLELVPEGALANTLSRLLETTGVENGYLCIGEPYECELQCGSRRPPAP